MEGEDLEILKLSSSIKNGFYVDAGCYHPLHLNNTYLLYQKKWRGINIDLSQYSIDLFNFIRADDININTAVSEVDGEITYYHQKKNKPIKYNQKKRSQKKNAGFDKRKKNKIPNTNNDFE